MEFIYYIRLYNLTFLKRKYLYLIIKFFILTIVILKFNFYINYSFKENNKEIKSLNIPKISIFLPIFNKGKYLKRSINSIQMQTLKDIEIIAVNDCSTDNSLEILEAMSKMDSRLIIVNNDKNQGLLFSRAIGILKTTGEYIMNLDPDDEFNNSDNLEYLYDIAKKSKSDIITFSTLFKSKDYISNKCTKFHNILRQPKLFESAFNSNGQLNDVLLWNKLIKREILLKSLKFFKKKIYEEKWNFHEDNIWSILIHKYAKSKVCINKIIYIYYSNYDSAMLNRGNLLELKNIINRHEMYKEIFISKKEEKYLIAEFSELLSFIEENNNFYRIIRENLVIRHKIINIFKNFFSNFKISKLNIKKFNILLNKLFNDKKYDISKNNF